MAYRKKNNKKFAKKSLYFTTTGYTKKTLNNSLIIQRVYSVRVWKKLDGMSFRKNDTFEVFAIRTFIDLQNFTDCKNDFFLLFEQVDSQ